MISRASAKLANTCWLIAPIWKDKIPFNRCMMGMRVAVQISVLWEKNYDAIIIEDIPDKRNGWRSIEMLRRAHDEAQSITMANFLQRSNSLLQRNLTSRTPVANQTRLPLQ